MPRVLTVSERDIWCRTLSMLLIGFACYALPWSVFAALPLGSDNSSVLRIQGSNTIGAKLGPALVKGLLEEQGLHKVRIEATGKDNEQRVVGQTSQGRPVRVDVAAHGSSTGFAALKNASADLAAASRAIKDSELVELETLGDLKSPGAEQVIAIDGLAIILNPHNPLTQLNTEQLARVFSGEVKTWEELGASAAPFIYMPAMINPGPTTPSRSWYSAGAARPWAAPPNASSPASNCPMRSARIPRASALSACPTCARPRPWPSSTASRRPCSRSTA